VRARSSLVLLLGSVACNVTPAQVTGGVDLPERGDCPRGVAVVASDYQSSEVALLEPTGRVASAAFLSSASTAATGLAAPFSGDLSVAPSRSRPGELVLIDRFGTNVLTFVDTRTAVVRAQLPVGTGFESNPQDYVELSEHLALVPRLGENRSPGREPFDAGSDVLIVDPSQPLIVGTLEVPRLAGFRPSPSAVTLLGDEVAVTLQHVRPDFSGMAEGELAIFDVETLELRRRVALEGLANCGRAELSPSRELVAVACTSFIDRQGNAPEPERSGLVLLDARDFHERARFGALELTSGPIQSSLEFASERLVLLKTQTAVGADRDNQLVVLDLETGAVTTLATAARDDGLGYGIALGGMTCHAGCGDPCLVSDASRGKLLRFQVKGSSLEPAADIVLDGSGLPPTTLSPFW
jgi:hypothetical protein